MINITPKISEYQAEKVENNVKIVEKKVDYSEIGKKIMCIASGLVSIYILYDKLREVKEGKDG
ncbi:hypothetical protein [Methanosarcina horonobensis]|uniref:hypothetical protein n=1 Tax=Methanosarcina horonobensis TaxID=418008 RepID=UPI00064EAE31|nr:hypothetical protein [Methanosarcina horonobensis]